MWQRWKWNVEHQRAGECFEGQTKQSRQSLHVTWYDIVDLIAALSDLSPPFPPWILYHVLPRAACILFTLVIFSTYYHQMSTFAHGSSQSFRHWHLHSQFSLVLCVFVRFPCSFSWLYQQLLQGPEVWVWSASDSGGKVTFHHRGFLPGNAKLTHGTLVR